MMPNSEPRDRFVCPYLTLINDRFFFLHTFFVPKLELITIYLKIRRTSGTSSNFGQIRPQTAELAALEGLKKFS